MRIRGDGPIPARVMIVGEYPSHDDERSGRAFDDWTGKELNKLLNESGILASECYKTHVLRARPPGGDPESIIPKAKKDVTSAHVAYRDRHVSRVLITDIQELYAEIALVQPNIIIAAGNLPLWVLTGQWGITKWRGSMLRMENGPKVIPTFALPTINRAFENKSLIATDFRRVKRNMGPEDYVRPEWAFIVRPSFDQAMSTIAALTSDAAAFADPVWLDFDIETRYGHIDCIGFSWSHCDAICIPFIARGKPEGYWSLEEEAHIVYALYRLLTHPNVRIRWQNGLYDSQYVYRLWHFLPRSGQDIMIAHHSVYAALPKGLSFLASLYADYYVYWKDEGKIASDVPEEQRWTYNLQDCVYTRAVGEALAQTHEVLGLSSVDAVQQALFSPVLKAMLKGVWIDPKRKEEMAVAVQEALDDRNAFLFNILGHSTNVGSPKQMQALFYDDLKQQPILNRTVRGGKVFMSASCDDEALAKIAAREPLLKPLCNAIADIRTLKKFLNDFVFMPLDADGRMRCSFNIAGDAGGKSAPYSYRLSSSENAFGSGGNLQTIPSEKSKSSGKAAARGSMDFTLPNIRSMYCPDPGYTFFDMDLDRADLQVVVAESGEAEWRKAMSMGIDMHLMNAFMISGKEPPPLEELVETHPKYWDHRGPMKHMREFAKVFCHATNYLGKAKTVAAHTGRTVHETEKAQAYWFSIHPGIAAWHARVWDQITRFRYIENRFGYRWYIFDRIDKQLLPKAVAWIPQSTVGNYINKIWNAFDAMIPELQVLLQVHDSLAGQFPTHRRSYIIPKMNEAAQIYIPYDPPLIIPTGVKTSEVSWGDCE